MSHFLHPAGWRNEREGNAFNRQHGSTAARQHGSTAARQHGKRGRLRPRFRDIHQLMPQASA